MERGCYSTDSGSVAAALTHLILFLGAIRDHHGVSPVDPASAGKVKKMVDSWLEWGAAHTGWRSSRERGYRARLSMSDRSRLREDEGDDDIGYNSIAHAADDNTNWWECYPSGPINIPGYYWPPTARHGYELDALVSAFETLGYAVCDGPELEPGFEKVAVYANEQGEWRHAAKQLPDGRWSSKLGECEDVAHTDPDDVAGEINGWATRYMKRQAR